MMVNDCCMSGFRRRSMVVLCCCDSYGIRTALLSLMVFSSVTTLTFVVYSRVRHYVVEEPFEDYTVATLTNSTSFRLEESMVNNHPYTFSLNAHILCSPLSHQISILIAVCSDVKNREARLAIRRTWASEIALQATNAKLVFFLGQTSHSVIQSDVNTESEEFQDIIQSNFADSYRNLSIKTMAMLKWVTEFCPNVNYVLKTDDDSFVNLNNLAVLLRGIQKKKFILGFVIVGADRDTNNSSKWFTPDELFPAIRYPNFCSGSAYVISRDTVGELYNTTLHTKLFWLEDVYVTGICAILSQVTLLHSSSFSSERCYNCWNFANLVSVHYINPEEMGYMWHILKSKGKQWENHLVILILLFSVISVVALTFRLYSKRLLMICNSIDKIQLWKT